MAIADTATPAALGGTSATGEPRARARRSAGFRSGAARIGRAVLLLLVGAAVGYVIGRVQGGFAVSDAEARLAQQRAASATALDEARTEHAQALAQAGAARAQADARAAELETTLALHRGALSIARARAALDARNFGFAEQHVREAQQTLQSIAGSRPEIEQVARALAQTRIVVAGNLEEQRAQLGALGASLDDALTPTAPTQPAPTTAPTTTAPTTTAPADAPPAAPPIGAPHTTAPMGSASDVAPSTADTLQDIPQEQHE